METEIRATFSRLSRATAASSRGGAGSSGTPASDRPPTVRLLPLMGALRPLLVRDGAVLVRAAANVLRSADSAPAAADGGSGSAAGGTSGSHAMVTLATPPGGSPHHQQQQQVRVRVFVEERGGDIVKRVFACGLLLRYNCWELIIESRKPRAPRRVLGLTCVFSAIPRCV